MSMKDMDTALQLIAANQHLAHFVGGRNPELVAAAERMLGVSFPATYRRFLTSLGAGSIGGEEFYGVIRDDFEHSGVPDAVWLTLRNRREFALPTPLVMVYDLGDGTHYMLDTAQFSVAGECPVVAYHGIPNEGDVLELVAPDFGAFFLEVVREELETRDT